MYRAYGVPFLGAYEVAGQLLGALKRGQGFSLVRLGGGETKSLGHDIFMPSREINQRYRYEYAGVRLPDERLRRELSWGVRNADVVGVLPYRRAPELIRIFDYLKIKPTRICSAYINWILFDEGKGLINSIIGSQRLFLVGRRAQEALTHVKKLGWQVEGFTTLEGFYDYRRALNEVKKHKKARLILVSAGIPAVVLCSKIAREAGRVALDFGHVIDRIIDIDFGSHNLIAKKGDWERKQSKR